MPREIPVGTDTAVEQPRLAPIALVMLEFPSGNFRVWSGLGTLHWGAGDAFDDHTDFDDGTGWDEEIVAEWYGIGDLGSIGEIEETTEVRAVGVELGLSGVREDVIDLALASNWQGRNGHIWLGVLDRIDGQLVGDPLLLLGDAKMDVMKLTEGKEASISLTLESEMIDLERVPSRRYTPEDQRAVYPGDAFFDGVSALQQQEFKWGRGF